LRFGFILASLQARQARQGKRNCYGSKGKTKQQNEREVKWQEQQKHCGNIGQASLQGKGKGFTTKANLQGQRNCGLWLYR
jgi:hypothetical protein